MRPHKICIAIQKSGRLNEESLAWLAKQQIVPSEPSNRKLLRQTQNPNIELLHVRHSDIVQYVRYGVAHFGIVGQNELFEKNINVDICAKLGFAKCALKIAVPHHSQIQSIEDLEGERIATSYPHSLKQFLCKHQIPCSIITINGSVEIAPELGLADAICDLVQTGSTLKEHGLNPIFTVFESQALLIQNHQPCPVKNTYLQDWLQNPSF